MKVCMAASSGLDDTEVDRVDHDLSKRVRNLSLHRKGFVYGAARDEEVQVVRSHADLTYRHVVERRRYRERRREPARWIERATFVEPVFIVDLIAGFITRGVLLCANQHDECPPCVTRSWLWRSSQSTRSY